jgi:high-affinity nickel-transport protein
VEPALFALAFLAMGFRHGLDSDHVAAVADLVGAVPAEESGRNFLLGAMYALGHGFVVLVAGLAAVMLGARLPEAVVEGFETLVGVTLLLLGIAIIVSIVRQGHYVSRLTLITQGLRRLFRRRRVASPDLRDAGIGGALIVGAIHGIGAETPTQIALLSAVAGVGTLLTAATHILLFTGGLLVATVLVSYAASWGFLRAASSRRVYLALGCLTGAYSMGLGLLLVL